MNQEEGVVIWDLLLILVSLRTLCNKFYFSCCMSLNPHYICTPDILKDKDGKSQVGIKARSFR